MELDILVLNLIGYHHHQLLQFVFDLSTLFKPICAHARWALMHRCLSVCLSVCLSGFTQATLYTTTTVYGVLVHQEGAICTMVTRVKVKGQAG